MTGHRHERASLSFFPLLHLHLHLAIRTLSPERTKTIRMTFALTAAVLLASFAGENRYAPHTQPLGVATMEPSASLAAAHRTDVNTETVRFETEDRVTIAGSFYPPKKQDERAPVALLVHDAGETSASLTELAEHLHKRGMAVLTIDLRGHGDSATADLDWKKMDETERERVWAYALRDVNAAADWIRTRKDVHTSNLTLIGVHAGCTLAAKHAVDDENARAVVLISPKAEELGCNLLRDLRDLGGLPTLILSDKDAREEAVRLCEAGHKANGGEEYIEVQYLKSKGEKVLDDRKLKTNVANWLRDQVMPRRGQ